MPDIKLPYTPEGEELVENIKEEVEAVGGKVDYAPGGTINAPDTIENYQLGGLIPGQPGFGERPIVNPLQNPVGNIPMYNKGGLTKVEKKERRAEKKSERKTKREIRRNLKTKVGKISEDTEKYYKDKFGEDVNVRKVIKKHKKAKRDKWLSRVGKEPGTLHTGTTKIETKKGKY